MKRLPPSYAFAAIVLVVSAFCSVHDAAADVGVAHISVVATATDAPAGPASAIVVTAAPQGAGLQHVTVQVLGDSQQVVRVIQADGNGRPQVVITSPMTHGAPTDANLAGNWGILFDVRFNDLVNLPRLPDTTGIRTSARFREALEWTTTTATAQGGPIMPLVSIPRTIALNGASFYAGGGMGTTPTLSWAAGPVGQPAFYRISVSQLFVDGTLTAGRTVAQILTPNTTFTFPLGILNSGSVYVFRLTPFVSTSAQGAALLASSPFKSGLDIATATTVSGEFVP